MSEEQPPRKCQKVVDEERKVDRAESDTGGSNSDKGKDDDDDDRFWMLWRNRDRKIVTNLARENVFTYAWDEAALANAARVAANANHRSSTPRCFRDLSGQDYEILFVSVPVKATSSSPKCISRTIKGSMKTLDEHLLSLVDGKIEADEEVTVVTIEVEQSTVNGGDEWEISPSTMMMNHVTLVEIQDSVLLLECDEFDPEDIMEYNLRVDASTLKQGGQLEWTPNEQVDLEPDDDRHDTGRDYQAFMHGQLQKRLEWKAEDWWPVHHTQLPVAAADNAHSFLMGTNEKSSLPPPFWEWREDDIWIELNPYPNFNGTTWETHYLARREKQDETKQSAESNE